jgi:L,D-transpeptidase catalytic domain/Putative peptidoglycan binding domain
VDSLRSFIRAHRWPALAVLGILILAGSIVGAAYAYDASKSSVIASGVRVGHVNLGGLSPAAAKRRLRRAFRSLKRPVVVRARHQRFTLTAPAAHVDLHLDRAVSEALDRSRSGWFLQRAVRELAGDHVNARIAPPITVSAAAVDRFVRRIRAQLDQPPHSARVEPSADHLTVIGGRDGITVDAAKLWRRVHDALISPRAPRRIAAPVSYKAPAMTLAKLRRKYRSYITLDRESFQLRVYQHLRLTRTYTVAVGQIGLETPAGVYHIQNKTVDPAWVVPHSAWAGSLAGQVITGADDPLKARWMGIFNGAGIHGTDETWSLGHAASHGCVRMSIPDVIDLYDRVQVGTPMYIG